MKDRYIFTVANWYEWVLCCFLSLIGVTLSLLQLLGEGKKYARQNKCLLPWQQQLKHQPFLMVR